MEGLGLAFRKCHYAYNCGESKRALESQDRAGAVAFPPPRPGLNKGTRLRPAAGSMH